MRIVEASGERRLLARGRRDADAGPGRMVRLKLTPLGTHVLTRGGLVTVVAQGLRWRISLAV